MTKFNIFCFHGCGQTPQVFKQLLKNLETKITKKYDCTFHYFQGNYKLPDKGFAWYKDKSTKYGYFINKFERKKDIASTNKKIEEHTNVILLGFSEGAMYAMDLALNFGDKSNIIGIVGLAPPYSIDVLNKKGDNKSELPGVMIVSSQDKNVKKKESEKWERHFSNLKKHETDKGHKVHLSAAVRDDIMKILDTVK